MQDFFHQPFKRKLTFRIYQNIRVDMMLTYDAIDRSVVPDGHEGQGASFNIIVYVYEIIIFICIHTKGWVPKKGGGFPQKKIPGHNT